MMGHTSTAMVDRVYGKLDENNLRRAIARMPGGTVPTQHAPEPDCPAGVTHRVQTTGTDGTHGATVVDATTADSEEEPADRPGQLVRAEGLEPSTSGLKVRWGLRMQVA
jgi:hypothetical protein